jgi:transposase
LRKTKLTKDLMDQAEKLLIEGNYTNTVCQYLNIHQSTWYKWLQDGEKQEAGLKKEFFDTIKRAEAQAEIRLLDEIRNIAKRESSWQANAWMLERKFPDRWSKREKIDLDAHVKRENREEIIIEQKLTTDPEAAELLKQLYRRSNALY